MWFKRMIFVWCLALLLVPLAGCGVKPVNQVSTKAARRSKDQKLFLSAVEKLKDHKYEEARPQLNQLLTAHPKSQLLPFAKLLLADSFYREGGTSNRAQAEVEYNEWIQLFPNHPLRMEVLEKIADIHVNQIGPGNGSEMSQHRGQERELRRLLKKFPEAEKNPVIQLRIDFVEENIAWYELNIMTFYFKHRKAWTGVVQRGLSIIRKYPHFSKMDETLFMLGMAYMEKEDQPESGKYLARLVREYPTSSFRDKAAEFLERFGVAIPEPEPDIQEKLAARQAREVRLQQFRETYQKPKSGEAILLTKDDTLKPQAVAEFKLPLPQK